MKDDAGLGLAIDWVQQALISAYEDNCPLKPVTTSRQSLRWTVELEALRRGVRRLVNKCQSDKNPHSYALYMEAQQNYRKEVRKASKNAWRTSVAPLMTCLGQVGYIRLYLGTLKLSWDLWWLHWAGICSPKGKP